MPFQQNSYRDVEYNGNMIINFEQVKI